MSIAGKTAQLTKPARMLRFCITCLLNHELFPQECYLEARERQVGSVNVRKLSELS